VNESFEPIWNCLTTTTTPKVKCELTPEQLQAAIDVEYKIPNPDYIPREVLLV
jgi:hypothetical protein